MKLEAVLALHPGPEADSVTLSVALAAAETKRAELLAEAAAADSERAAGLLSADDKALAAAGRAVETARLAAERVAAILPQLRADLATARGRETVADLQADATKLERLIAKVGDWQTNQFPRIAEMIGAGLHAEQEAIEAYAALVSRIDVAFASQAVRDAAPDGVQVKAPGGHRPSHLFPTWQLPTHV